MASKTLTSRQRRELNSEVLSELEPGDLIQFPRGLYSHWAVFIGKEEVVHLAGDDNDGVDAQVDSGFLVGSVSGRVSGKAWVKRQKFWDVVGDSVAVKNNEKDERYRPLPKRQIVMNAMSSLGKAGYNVLTQNCEHFASWCRYGEWRSDQVTKAIGAAVVGVALVVHAVKNRKSKSQICCVS